MQTKIRWDSGLVIYRPHSSTFMSMKGIVLFLLMIVLPPTLLYILTHSVWLTSFVTIAWWLAIIGGDWHNRHRRRQSKRQEPPEGPSDPDGGGAGKPSLLVPSGPVRSGGNTFD